jgi:hypothetical protein
LLPLKLNSLSFEFGSLPLLTLSLYLGIKFESPALLFLETGSFLLGFVGKTLTLGFGFLLLPVTLLFLKASNFSLLSFIFFLFESESLLFGGFPFKSLSFEFGFVLKSSTLLFFKSLAFFLFQAKTFLLCLIGESLAFTLLFFFLPQTLFLFQSYFLLLLFIGDPGSFLLGFNSKSFNLRSSLISFIGDSHSLSFNPLSFSFSLCSDSLCLGFFLRQPQSFGLFSLLLKMSLLSQTLCLFFFLLDPSLKFGLLAFELFFFLLLTTSQ